MTVLRAATLDFFDRDLVRCPMLQVDEEKAALSGICSLALDRALVRDTRTVRRTYALTHAETQDHAHARTRGDPHARVMNGRNA